MTTFRMPILTILSALLLASCGDPPEVVQGTVVSHDASANVMVIRDECPPNAQITLLLEGAEIGAAPEVDDVVRVAFRAEGDKGRAVRVMNLTRQKDLGIASQPTGIDRCQRPEG